ncbi:MAG: OmpH family outer membrane protein [Duncaniella sp.]|nr:OmpH family outer membrane protein [Duncaniella sp.]MDE5960891.1 OmpH family outer membrane protein [Duncaniella sp.]MDE6188415.1 OmpH family outer membrane protein [Duncaniella sp.]
MKKIFLTLALVLACFAGASAQKFALVDMDYILSNVPAYEMANEQLNQISQRWQKEVEAVAKEAETLYKNYQNEMVFLTDEQKKKKEAEIVGKEKQAAELRQKYFGPDGELYKKRQTLMKPIQDDVYNAVKKVSEERGYQCIFDRASSADIIFASPRIDVSNEVLEKLGYSK